MCVCARVCVCVLERVCGHVVRPLRGGSDDVRDLRRAVNLAADAISTRAPSRRSRGDLGGDLGRCNGVQASPNRSMNAQFPEMTVPMLQPKQFDRLMWPFASCCLACLLGFCEMEGRTVDGSDGFSNIWPIR